VVSDIRPGERFADPVRWEDQSASPHIWRTLGFERCSTEPGLVVIGWDADPAYGFPSGTGTIIHGGMVSTLLDSAMGGAAWTVLDNHEVFLTADLRVEFLRAARPGPLQAEGRVIRRTKRVIFCAADLHDPSGEVLASARCTQVILPAEGPGRRPPIPLR
jgi:uncharacterized protein (TIGR00369 family)